MDAVLLAERLLRKHDPASFDMSFDAWPECIEYVRAVEDDQAWKAVYPTLGAFSAAHEGRHPDIRYYARARREMMTADPLTSPGGPSERLSTLRAKSR